MKRCLTGWIVAMLAALSITTAAAQKNPQAEAMLAAARQKETVEGDLTAAINQYKAIAARYAKTDRSTAAMALIRMAQLYQKMGDAESRKIYEQVMKDYADQKDAVTLARAGLGGNGTSTVMNSRLVWSGPKVDDEGTVSPDGRYVSHPDWETGDLAIHDFATGLDRHITNTKNGSGKWTQYAEESAISKDGKQVAYSWWDEKTDRFELRLANLTGDANPRRLYDNPDTTWLMPFDWAPNGKFVAVQVTRNDRTAQLGLVSVPDGSFRVLKSVDWRGARRMFFSPDGQWLGCDLPEADSAERDVFVLSVDGSHEVHAVDHGGQDEMVGWSPDGKWLLFSSDRTASTDLWAVAFGDGSTQGSPQLLKAGFERSVPIGVTPSGTLYYGQVKGGGPSTIQVSSLDIAAGKLTSPPLALPQNYRDSDTSPAWSPDGKRIAYVSQRGAQHAKSFVLVIRSIESGQVRELQPNLDSLALDSWAPDGRSLLVNGRDSKGRWGMHLADVETGDVRALSFDQAAYGVNWAPDGRSFLIQTRGSRTGLYRVDVGTGNASEVMPIPTEQGNQGLYPAWSPDGKSFYYHRLFKSKAGTGEEFAIMERNLSTGVERELARRPFFLGPPKLTRDGQHIVADSVDPDSNSRVILLIPIKGGQSRELMRMPSKVKLEDLNNFNLGQWPIPAPALTVALDPLLVLKRLGDRTGGLGTGKDPSEFWLVPLSGGEPQKIGNTPAGFTLGSMALTQDGRHLAWAVTDAGSRQTREVWALENFLPKPAAASKSVPSR